MDSIISSSSSIEFDHVVNLCVSFLVYCVAPLHYTLFNEPWTRALGKSENEKLPHPGAMYLMGFLNTLTMTYILAYYLQVLHVATASAVLYHSLVLGLGLAVVPLMTHHNFAHGVKASMVATMVDGLYDVISIIITAGVLVFWK